MTERASTQPKVLMGDVSPKELGITQLFPPPDTTLDPDVMLALSGILSETYC